MKWKKEKHFHQENIYYKKWGFMPLNFKGDSKMYYKIFVVFTHKETNEKKRFIFNSLEKAIAEINLFNEKFNKNNEYKFLYCVR